MKNLIYILLITLCVSCKTKHKVIEKSKTDLTESSVNLETKGIAIETSTDIVSSEITLTNFKNAEFRQNGTQNIITITDNKGNSFKVQGADFILSSKESSVVKKDTLSFNEKSTDTTTTSEDFKKTLKSSNRNVEVDIKTTSTWLWIWLIIISIVIIVLYRLRVFKF